MRMTAELRLDRAVSAGVTVRPDASSMAAFPVETSHGTIRLLVTSDIRGLKPRWESLQQLAPCTAMQTYAFAEAWTRLVLAPRGNRPVIVVGAGRNGADFFLWPFETRTVLGMRLLTFLGAREANYGMGLFAPAAPDFSGDDLTALLKAVARAADASGALLLSQPEHWDGRGNPFATLKRQEAPSHGYAVRLGDFDALYRRRFSGRARGVLKRKEQKLATVAPLTYGWAETEAERIALLEMVFAQKSRQLAAQGIADPFTPPVRAVYRALASLEEGNPAKLRLGYLKAGDTVAATFSGFVCHGRFSACFSSLGDGDMQRHSPGSLLLRHQIEQASADGLRLYDLGTGSARNKSEWCEVTQPLFDQFFAFTPAALAITAPLAAWRDLKRALKAHTTLWPLAQKWRKRLFGSAAAPCR